MLWFQNNGNSSTASIADPYILHIGQSIIHINTTYTSTSNIINIIMIPRYTYYTNIRAVWLWISADAEVH